MDSFAQNTSDQNILSMIAANNLEAWEQLYDKYAPAMYGIICNLTDDESLAEEIFKDSFVQLKERQILSKSQLALCPSLIRHTYTFTRQQLKERGITTSESKLKETSLINILCSQNITIKEVASNFEMTEEETKKKLHLEFLELRSQSEEEKQSQQ